MNKNEWEDNMLKNLKSLKNFLKDFEKKLKWTITNQ